MFGVERLMKFSTVFFLVFLPFFLFFLWRKRFHPVWKTSVIHLVAINQFNKFLRVLQAPILWMHYVLPVNLCLRSNNVSGQALWTFVCSLLLWTYASADLYCSKKVAHLACLLNDNAEFLASMYLSKVGCDQQHLKHWVGTRRIELKKILTALKSFRASWCCWLQSQLRLVCVIDGCAVLVIKWSASMLVRQSVWFSFFKFLWGLVDHI